MLYSIDDLEIPITEIPHRKEYDRWRRKLSDQEYESIMNELNDRVGDDEIQTSSWIPGDDWSGSPFEPIYYACDEDETQAGLFFGSLVWEFFMNHREDWSFGRYSVNNVPIRGLTYFRIKRERKQK